MKFVIVASALVFLLTGPAWAWHGPRCKTFDRSSTDAPQFVRDYLDNSTALSVSACGNTDLTFYYEAENLVHDGHVCRYSMNELNLSHTSPSRLERTAKPPLTFMSVSESSTCPLAETIKYAQIDDDVPQDVFERLVRVWRDAISSPASFDRRVPLDANDWHRRSRSRVRNVILEGRSDRLAVLGAHRDLLGMWKGYELVWKRYELHVEDPDHLDQVYVVTVTSWFGRPYAITAVSAGMY